jgi:dihydrofolate reductase
MPRIIAFIHLTLDGVMQAPARPDEDTRDGFRRGGWANGHDDPVMAQAVGESMGTTGAILLGRRTYEDFHNVWPKRTDNPFAPILNNALKYVASRTLAEPLPWMNSRLLPGNAEDSVAALRDEPGKDIIILGSGTLVQSLLRRKLIDELMLMIHPVVLGSGRRLFAEDGTFAKLVLEQATPTTKGVVITRYRPL